jgi:F-type H+-transporting ATPase subunit b
MEIFEIFGLNGILIIAQIVNFLVILYILKRFLYKPLFSVLEKRQQLAKEAVEKADESSKALEDAQEKEKEIIRKAQETAAQIIADAKEQSADMIKKAEENTKKQTDKMLADAKTQIEQETQHAQSQLNKYVAKLSVDLLKKSLANVFTEKEQSEIIERAVKEIQKRPN